MTGQLIENTLDDHVRALVADPERAARYFSRSWLTKATRTLRDTRKRAELTQTEVARRLGTTQSAVARLERDREGRYTIRRYVDFVVACGAVPTDLSTVQLAQAQALAAVNPAAPITHTTVRTWSPYEPAAATNAEFAVSTYTTWTPTGLQYPSNAPAMNIGQLLLPAGPQYHALLTINASGQGAYSAPVEGSATEPAKRPRAVAA